MHSRSGACTIQRYETFQIRLNLTNMRPRIHLGLPPKRRNAELHGRESSWNRSVGTDSPPFQR